MFRLVLEVHVHPLLMERKGVKESLGARLGEDVGAVEVVKSVEREKREKREEKNDVEERVKRKRRSNQAVEAFRAQLLCEVWAGVVDSGGTGKKQARLKRRRRRRRREKRGGKRGGGEGRRRRRRRRQGEDTEEVKSHMLLRRASDLFLPQGRARCSSSISRSGSRETELFRERKVLRHVLSTLSRFAGLFCTRFMRVLQVARVHWAGLDEVQQRSQQQRNHTYLLEMLQSRIRKKKKARQRSASSKGDW